MGGRNYEYYSEDPLISGTMGAAVVEGSLKSGTYCYVKHFAANNQDSYRDSLYTWMTEQSLREIYLSAFRYGVEKGVFTGIMVLQAGWTPANDTTQILCSWSLLDDLKYEEVEIVGLGNAPEDGVVGRLLALFDLLELDACVMYAVGLAPSCARQGNEEERCPRYQPFQPAWRRSCIRTSCSGDFLQAPAPSPISVR